jgi:hypothetical protein
MFLRKIVDEWGAGRLPPKAPGVAFGETFGKSKKRSDFAAPTDTSASVGISEAPQRRSAQQRDTRETLARAIVRGPLDRTVGEAEERHWL